MIIKKISKIVFWLSISYLFHALIIGIADRHEADTLVGKILLPASAVDQHTTTQSISDVSSSLNEVVSFSFDTAVKLGIKRRSNIVGQIYDYLRLADQHAAVSVKLFESAVNDTKKTSNAMTLAINVTFSGIDRQTDHIQSERNQHRCGTSNCVSISQSVTINSAASNLQYFEVSASSEAGTIEIDNQMYPIESSIYCLVYYSSNASVRDRIESVEFSAYFVELKTNYQNESISEMSISNYETSYYFVTLNVVIALIIIYCFLSFFNEDKYRYEVVYLLKCYKIIVVIILSPFAYILTLLLFKIIDEVRPFSVNIFIFVILNVLLIICSTFIKLN